MLKGGETLGSLTLLRWYAAHVFLLPAALIAFVVAHLYLMRRHGISGALKHVEGPSKPFYPDHAFKDTMAGAAVFALLADVRHRIQPAAGRRCGPDRRHLRSASRVVLPQPVSAAEVLPGPLEPLATMVIPGLVVALLFFLPFLDARADRHPLKRPLVTGGFGLIGLGIIVLTYLGYQDTPAHADPTQWTPLAIAGQADRDGPAVHPLSPPWRSGQPHPRDARSAAIRSGCCRTCATLK